MTQREKLLSYNLKSTTKILLMIILKGRYPFPSHFGKQRQSTSLLTFYVNIKNTLCVCIIHLDCLNDFTVVGLIVDVWLLATLGLWSFSFGQVQY